MTADDPQHEDPFMAWAEGHPWMIGYIGIVVTLILVVNLVALLVDLLG